MLRLEDDDEHRAARVQLLAWDLLLRRHHSFDPAKVDVDRAGLDSVHDTGGQLAPVLRNVTQHLVALQVVDVPEHRVLGRLRRHPLEWVGWKRLDDLGAVRAHEPAPHFEGPGLGVELHRHETSRVERAHVGCGEGALHRVQHLLEGDAHLGAERGQRFAQALGGRLRWRPRACPRQRHPMQCEQ